MDKHRAATDIITQAVKLAPFEGWNYNTIAQAAQLSGYKRTDVIRVFPGGAADAAEFLLESYNRTLIDTLRGYHLVSMKIRERIVTIIRVKLEIMEADREALRKIFSLMALPFHCHKALRHLYETVDIMWHEAGDTSTDFNFYTKRLTLAGVYTTTVLFWLDDKSPGCEASWAFLDRRIQDIMAIEKAKHIVKNGKLRALFRQKPA